MGTTVIGISGASASGKSTFSQALLPYLGDNAVYLPIDRFYKKELPRMISPLDGKDYPNWNHPASIDSSAAHEYIVSLLESENPPEYLIIDGAFIFCIDCLRQLMDYKIFITASIETRIYRRIKRNVILKKQTIEQIGEYYLATVRYCEREFSLPSQKYANLVIENEKDFSLDPKVVSDIIKKLKTGTGKTKN